MIATNQPRNGMSDHSHQNMMEVEKFSCGCSDFIAITNGSADADYYGAN